MHSALAIDFKSAMRLTGCAFRSEEMLCVIFSGCVCLHLCLCLFTRKMDLVESLCACVCLHKKRTWLRVCVLVFVCAKNGPD